MSLPEQRSLAHLCQQAGVAFICILPPQSVGFFHQPSWEGLLCLSAEASAQISSQGSRSDAGKRDRELLGASFPPSKNALKAGGNERKGTLNHPFLPSSF